MKKAIFFIFVGILAVLFFVERKQSEELVTPVPHAGVQMRGIKNSHADTFTKSAETALPSGENDKDPFKELPTLHELERQYIAYKNSELESEMLASKSKLVRSGILEKAQSDSLNSQERRVLVLEMRRQGVLSQLLVDAKLKKMKEKYL